MFKMPPIFVQKDMEAYIVRTLYTRKITTASNHLFESEHSYDFVTINGEWPRPLDVTSTNRGDTICPLRIAFD